MNGISDTECRDPQDGPKEGRQAASRRGFHPEKNLTCFP